MLCMALGLMSNRVLNWDTEVQALPFGELQHDEGQGGYSSERGLLVPWLCTVDLVLVPADGGGSRVPMSSSPSSWAQELGWVWDLPAFQLLELLWDAGRKPRLPGEGGLSAGGLVSAPGTQKPCGKG